jgi:hypothetical protein
MIKGSGSVPCTNGSGSGRPGNLRIRIRNIGVLYAGFERLHFHLFGQHCGLVPVLVYSPFLKKNMQYVTVLWVIFSYVQILKQFFNFATTFGQGFGSIFIWYGSGSSILGWIGTSWKKNYIFLDQKLGTVYLSLGLNKRTSKLQKNPSALKREHPELQNMKFLNFFLLFIFALLNPNTDPDPLTWLNLDPIRIRIRNPAFGKIILRKWNKTLKILYVIQ